jgi:hypothetical protein
VLGDGVGAGELPGADGETLTDADGVGRGRDEDGEGVGVAVGDRVGRGVSLGVGEVVAGPVAGTEDPDWPLSPDCADVGAGRT